MKLNHALSWNAKSYTRASLTTCWNKHASVESFSHHNNNLQQTSIKKLDIVHGCELYTNCFNKQIGTIRRDDADVSFPDLEGLELDSNLCCDSTLLRICSAELSSCPCEWELCVLNECVVCECELWSNYDLGLLVVALGVEFILLTACDLSLDGY